MSEATATIGSDKVVSVHYVLTSDQGTELDRSEKDQPLAYLHGAGNIVPGLEEALEGKAVGDKVEVSIPPEKAYGERQGPKPQEVPRSSFPSEVPINVGMQFFTEGPEGQPIPIWVVKVQGPTIVVDFNHPLAGETLHFEVDIVDVRDATEEELEHGHVHGPGGHHHEEDEA